MSSRKSAPQPLIHEKFKGAYEDSKEEAKWDADDEHEDGLDEGE